MTESNDPSSMPPPPPPIENPQAVNYAGPNVEISKDARTWGMLAHLSSLAGLIIPFGSVIGPLVVWLVKKDEYPFANDQGKEAVNFHITVLLALVLLSPTICIGIGVFILPAVGLAGLIMSVIGAVKANEGIAYRYPFALRLIK